MAEEVPANRELVRPAYKFSVFSRCLSFVQAGG